MGEAGGAVAAQLTLLQQEAGYRVRDHFSGALAFAPIPSSSRSVVARSAAMPFWSCSIDLTPFADLGSLSMFRSFLFRRQSEIAFQSMVPHIEFGAMCRDTRLFGVLLLNFGNEALVSVVANGTSQRHAGVKGFVEQWERRLRQTGPNAGLVTGKFLTRWHSSACFS